MRRKSGLAEVENGLAVTHIPEGREATPETRDMARLALHLMAVKAGGEGALEELIFMLGLNVTDKDVVAGYSYAPCVVDGVEHLKHRPYPPPGKLPSRRRRA